MEKAIVMKKLENVFETARAKVPKGLLDTVKETSISNGKQLRVAKGNHSLNVDVLFYATLTEAMNPDLDLSAVSESALGLPTIVVKCLGYGDLSSYRLEQLNDFASELAGDIERQVKYAQRLLEMRDECSP